MQIRLTSQAESLLEEFMKKSAELLAPNYDLSATQVANGMLVDKLREELKRFEIKKP